MRFGLLYTLAFAALSCARTVKVPGADVAITDVTVIDGNGGEPRVGQTVLIEDGRITRVGRDAKVPDDAAVIDIPESTVMPGLVDANARFGIRGDACEQSDEVTPAFHIWDAIDLGRQSADPEMAANSMQAATVVFDAGATLESPYELLNVLPRMSYSSVYYHFVEARRRTEEKVDDFTAWCYGVGDECKDLIEVFKGIDFYYMTLPELKKTLIEAVKTLPAREEDER